jgi:hypothetical protein
MYLQHLAKEFFSTLDERIGPFDRPILFRPFPFDVGGSLNFLTVGAGREKVVTYVSWDLFGHNKLKQGKLGRYEFITHCDNEKWCSDIITNIGRQALSEVFDPDDIMDVSPWIGDLQSNLRGVIFEEGFSTQIRMELGREQCGLLRCIGVTTPELNFAREHGVPSLVKALKISNVYPNTILMRSSIELPPKQASFELSGKVNGSVPNVT